MRLSNKVALVTGANKGIGLSIVESLLQEGSFVYAGIRDLEKASDTLRKLLESYPSNLRIVTLDVTKAELCKEIFQAIKKEQGKIDILVNNAGIVTYELVPFIQFEKFEEMFQTNVVGLIRMCQLASRFMTKQSSGSIINISSIVSVKGAAGQASYAATKGAVNAFTISLSKELAHHKIRVNAIAPGMVSTERLVAVAEEKFKDQINKIGFGRMANPEEIGQLSVFLGSDESCYITGQIIGIDGSQSL